LAKRLGVTEELLDAMYHIDEHAHLFTPTERAALSLAERLTTDPHGVDEEVWATLRAHFDEGQIIELVAVIGLFNYFNRFNEALRVEITPPATGEEQAEE
jgi:alkylhydroperoxidase family enzyme